MARNSVELELLGGLLSIGTEDFRGGGVALSERHILSLLRKDAEGGQWRSFWEASGSSAPSVEQ